MSRATVQKLFWIPHREIAIYHLPSEAMSLLRTPFVGYEFGCISRRSANISDSSVDFD